jgi:hypothetical protein
MQKETIFERYGYCVKIILNMNPIEAMEFPSNDRVKFSDNDRFFDNNEWTKKAS